MKYIAQYIKKLCPDVAIKKSNTTESVYYCMSHNFKVRLSEHIGYYEKGQISVIKSFNTDEYIVMVENCPFPIIKNRKEVNELIKNLYEISMLEEKTKEYYALKEKREIDSITEWDIFWNKACVVTSNAYYLSKSQKEIIKEKFNDGLRGEEMINIVKKIKPSMAIEAVRLIFEKVEKEVS